MGREAVCTVHWRGETAEALVLLESDELIVRGPLRARIPRMSIDAVRAADGRLTLRAGDEALWLDLGPKAGAWARALAAAPRSLAAKLGVGPDRPLLAIAPPKDAALAAAAAPALTGSATDAAQLLAEILTPGDLDLAVAFAARHPRLPIWCAHAKGRAADPGDAAIRARFRAAGYVDTKSCAVSARLTATRYAPRAGR